MMIEKDKINQTQPIPGPISKTEARPRRDHLVYRGALSIQSKTEEQRENLFYTRCHVNGKLCSLVIDGGSCTNVASEKMVQKLGLEVKDHPKPYNIHWLNETGEMKVEKQVTVPIIIGRYKDEILCDMLPMESRHMLFGRPWQFYRRVQHEGFTNRYSFEYKGRKIVLVLMTPQEVYQDQVHLKTKAETKANKECEDVTTLIVSKEEPPGSLQEVQLQESPKEATPCELGEFTKPEAVWVHNQLHRVEDNIVIKEKPPDASPPIKTREISNSFAYQEHTKYY
ncbi:hypothetical protein V5N11_019788 [Cardamine amara subsp. amara]|uniref:Uncharacterized protein n=1 Tax=Cardamine amara subsp. amara TaxID=228776 RepID=A0ABD1BTC8_CARAN